MIINTERLELVILTANELALWTSNLSKLEEKLNCKYKAEPLEDWFVQLIDQQFTATKDDEKNAWCHSFWFIIRKTDRVVVGSADFKDKPNENGEVEIGYGLGKEFEHNGYMTEAVRAMCSFAFKQKGVQAIIAETESENLKSQHILQRNGFEKYKEEKNLWWRLNS